MAADRALPTAPGATRPPAVGLLDLPVTELRDRLASGAVRAVEVARAVAARVAERDENVGAWAFFDPDHLMRQAQMLDRYRGTGRALGPLHGLPVAIKDVIDTADMPTANGTPLDADRRPDTDAALVTALRAAGAMIAGKTVTAELAFLYPGKTRNPRDRARTPGGSSSGSAAAVAAGMVPLAVGTQTGGSVLRPASFCGTVGFKPSFGAIPTRGVLRQSPSLDTVGVFAWDVEGAALVAEALYGAEPDAARAPMTWPAPHPQLLDAARSAPPLPPTFAFVRTPWWDRASEDMRGGMEELAAALGARCFEAELPTPFGAIPDLRERVNLVEMAFRYSSYERRGAGELSSPVREAMTSGRDTGAVDYLAALEWRTLHRAGLDALLDRCDAVLMPAAPGVAPEGLGSTGDSVFNALATYLGAPAISLPLLQSDGPNGPLPMGVQLVGRSGDDARLLRTARWLEKWIRDDGE